VNAPRRYDVAIFDSVGGPYTGSTSESSGPGGPARDVVPLAEMLVRRGLSVLVLNGTLLPATERGVDYVNHGAAVAGAFECGALVIARYSYVPAVPHGRLLVLASDHPGGAYDHLAPYLAENAGATLVAASAEQRALFPAGWSSVIIPDSQAESAWLEVLGLERKERRASSAQKVPTLCVTMIVKNEAHVIRRCLESVKPIISSWEIVDTGSTDGTQDIVREVMKGIPGELHERPWKDFGTNRTEAIALASGKADYLIVIDADDILEDRGGFDPASLTRDAHDLRVEDHGSVYYRTHILRADLDFRYVGVVHEALVGSSTQVAGRVEGLVYTRLGGGDRSRDLEKFRKDAALLEKALRAEPDNARYAFYLAQSWKDAGEHAKALPAYERRAAMGGWAEEVWASLFAIAQLSEQLGKDDEVVIGALLRAHEFRPQRAEALSYLARFCRIKNRFVLAHLFASAAIQIPRPEADNLWVDESVYTWRSLDEYAIASYYVGRHGDAIRANQQLLASPHLPPAERDRVLRNMAFSTAVLGQR